MLENFQIQGFRCFSDFRIEGLRRINLIAGKNGVGKSALLEAIKLYRRPSRNSLIDLLDRRDDAIVGKTTWSIEAVAPLFFRDLPSKSAFLHGDAGILNVRVGWYRQDSSGKWEEQSANEGSADSACLLRLEFPGSRHASRSIELTNGKILQRQPGIFAPISDPTLYVPSLSFTTEKLAFLFEDIAGTDEEDEVNRLVKWIIPDADRIFTKGASGERMIFVKRRGVSGAEPLRQFGDGAVKLTGLALTLVNSKDGCCLLDEIENGIHYELFDQIWEKLSLLSQALNVQVFATTHSKDCIEAFERSYRHPHFDACFHRLERTGDKISAVRFDNESYFSVVAGQEHEIR